MYPPIFRPRYPKVLPNLHKSCRFLNTGKGTFQETYNDGSGKIITASHEYSQLRERVHLRYNMGYKVTFCNFNKATVSELQLLQK